MAGLKKAVSKLKAIKQTPKQAIKALEPEVDGIVDEIDVSNILTPEDILINQAVLRSRPKSAKTYNGPWMDALSRVEDITKVVIRNPKYANGHFSTEPPVFKKANDAFLRRSGPIVKPLNVMPNLTPFGGAKPMLQSKEQRYARSHNRDTISLQVANSRVQSTVPMFSNIIPKHKGRSF